MNKSTLLAAVMTTIVLAEAPRTMLFQGSVSKKGAPLTGMHNVVIDICTGKTAEQKDCAALYPKKAIEFKQGYYSVVLGEEKPLPVFDKQYYLEVYIDGTVSMERIPLTSTPSALNAIRADSSKYAKLADTTAGGAKRADVALTAKSADLAIQIPGVKSSKDSTYFSNAALSFDDTTSFGSLAGTTEGKGLWNINTLLSKDTANVTIAAERSSVIGTTGSKNASHISLTNREIELYVTANGYSGNRGGGSASTFNITPDNIEISTARTLTAIASDISLLSNNSVAISAGSEEVMKIDYDTTVVKNVFRTTGPAVLIIPTNSSICENDPCSIDGQIIIGTKTLCGGGTSTEYYTANNMMVCRGHYGKESLHWNHVE